MKNRIFTDEFLKTYKHPFDNAHLEGLRLDKMFNDWRYVERKFVPGTSTAVYDWDSAIKALKPIFLREQAALEFEVDLENLINEND